MGSEMCIRDRRRARHALPRSKGTDQLVLRAAGRRGGSQQRVWRARALHRYAYRTGAARHDRSDDHRRSYDFAAVCGRMDLHGGRQALQQQIPADPDGAGTRRITQKGGVAMKHIAVVEDEALMREELADMLRFAVGFNGPVALRYPRGEAYDGFEESDAGADEAAPQEQGRCRRAGLPLSGCGWTER